MVYRPTGHATVDPNSPRAWATCDRCGGLYNHRDLQYQYQWTGNQLTNLRQLVCQTCLDNPQEQLRSFVLPPDPVPIIDPRPEPYGLEEPSFLATEQRDDLMTEDGRNLVLEGGVGS